MSASDFTNDPLSKSTANDRAGRNDASAHRTAHAAWASTETELTAMNVRHALVLAGDKAVILMEIEDPYGNSDIRLVSVDAFKKFYANRLVLRGDKLVGLAKAWLESKERRTYTGLTFRPTSLLEDAAPANAGGSYYNLWRGFAVNPEPGDCSIFLDHVRTNVCCGVQALAEWVLGWCAQLIQRPNEKLGTSIVLRGAQGVGKTKFGEVLGSLFPAHYALIDDPRYLTGNFNNHMASCLLLQADEAFWAGDRAAEGRLKSLVTSSRQFIEKKGIDPFPIPNFLRLLITSNHRWVVPAGLDERRFAVLDVGDIVKQDHGYFAAMDDQLDAGGRAALLDFLLKFDTSKVNLRQIPRTEALEDQKIASLTPIEAWWFECLRAGENGSDGIWLQEVPSKQLFKHYCAHAEIVGVRHRSLETQVGIALRDLVPKLNRKRLQMDGTSKRGWYYVLPELEVCRAAFSDKFGWTKGWDDL